MRTSYEYDGLVRIQPRPKTFSPVLNGEKVFILTYSSFSLLV